VLGEISQFPVEGGKSYIRVPGKWIDTWCGKVVVTMFGLKKKMGPSTPHEVNVGNKTEKGQDTGLAQLVGIPVETATRNVTSVGTRSGVVFFSGLKKGRGRQV